MGTEIGRRLTTLVDIATQEEVEAVAVYKSVSEETYLKVQLGDLLALIGITGSKQASVIAYILKKTEYGKNMFFGTYRELVDAIGVSKYTVTQTMTALIKAKLMAPVRHGVYQLSPALAYKGKPEKRAYIVHYYEQNCQEVDDEYVEHAKPKDIYDEMYKQDMKSRKRNRDTSGPAGRSD